MEQLRCKECDNQIIEGETSCPVCGSSDLYVASSSDEYSLPEPSENVPSNVPSLRAKFFGIIRFGFSFIILVAVGMLCNVLTNDTSAREVIRKTVDNPEFVQEFETHFNVLGFTDTSVECLFNSYDSQFKAIADTYTEKEAQAWLEGENDDPQRTYDLLDLTAYGDCLTDPIFYRDYRKLVVAQLQKPRAVFLDYDISHPESVCMMDAMEAHSGDAWARINIVTQFSKNPQDVKNTIAPLEILYDIATEKCFN